MVHENIPRLQATFWWDITKNDYFKNADSITLLVQRPLVYECKLILAMSKWLNETLSQRFTSGARTQKLDRKSEFLPLIKWVA